MPEFVERLRERATPENCLLPLSRASCPTSDPIGMPRAKVPRQAGISLRVSNDCNLLVNIFQRLCTVKFHLAVSRIEFVSAVWKGES